jgi:hypothetical protein
MKHFIYRLYTIVRQHEDGCDFFDNFGIFIQCILGLVSLSFLVLKRYMERPRREWYIWILDTSKQIAGQLTQHAFNLVIATHLGNDNSLECEWYVMNLVNDTTVGLLYQFMYLKLFQAMLKGTQYEFETGEYGKDTITTYFHQLFIWLFIVIVVKLS